MIQVHGDRMCGSFSSAVFNHRTDRYGGGPENRARFAVEAVSAVRRRLPDIPIDYKLAVRQEDPHYGNAGVLESELPVFVPLLEQAGVTSFHVTLANHSALTDTIPPKKHPEFGGEGCFLKFCDQVRQLTQAPSLRRGRPDRPGLCGCPDPIRPHRLRRHEPPAHCRPGLAPEGAGGPGGHHPSLRALQQGVPGRPDGPPGRPLYL